MVGGSRSRVAAGPLFLRRFHPAAGGCKDCPPEQALVYGLLMRSAAQPLNLLATERLK